MELDLLEEEQIFRSNRLNIFDKFGTRAAITDFAILLGGYVSENNHTKERNDLASRTGIWWTKSYHESVTTYIVSSNGFRSWNFVNEDHIGIRPIIYYSLTNKKNTDNCEIKEIEYGEYPQWVVSKNFSSELEKEYIDGSLTPTGKNYITDSVANNCKFREFNKRTHTEYEYKGNKYIRFIGDINGNEKILSDGRIIKSNKIYWIKVEPVIWLVSAKENIAITKNILVSGIQFNNIKNYQGNLKNTNIYKFMNNYMIKEMFYAINLNNTKDKEFISIDSRMNDIKKRIRRLQER